MSFMRPTSLAPRTSTTAQDEILRIAALQAAMTHPEISTATAFDIRMIEKGIRYDIQTARLGQYADE